MRKKLSFFVCLVGAVGIAACASSGDNPDGPNPGADGGDSCIDGATQCDGNTFQTCSSNAWETTNQCTGLCDSNLGCVDCNPGQNYCVGDDVFSCDGQGKTQGLVETCSGGLHCSGGTCLDLCADAEANRSYIGCDYFAVDLDNAIEVVMSSAGFFGCLLAPPGTVERNDLPVCYDGENTAGECEDGGTCPAGFTCQTTPVCVLDAQGSPFAVVVSNPQGIDAQVTISNQSGQTETMTVAAGQVQSIFPQQLGFADQSLNGSGVSPNAYRIESDVPIVAYQFNPLDNVDVFSNDASLLLPTSALGSRYLALSWPQTIAVSEVAEENFGIDLRTFLTVVATQDDTIVRVKLSTDIVAGGPFPAAVAGEMLEFTLDAFEVANFETGGFNADFTGTAVESPDDKPVAVFAGGEASDVPFFDTIALRLCCADHLEEQLFPETAFGTQFVAVKTPLRTFYVDQAGWDVAVVPDEPEYWRILATHEDTSISTDLPPPNNAFFLQRGDFVTFESERDFIVQASDPIAFGQFPASQQTTGIPSTIAGERAPGGDPAYITIPPVQQWRDDYLFLVPNRYAFDFLLIAAPSSAVIEYDGSPLADALPRCEYEPIGTLPNGANEVEYSAIRCPLSAPMPGDEGLQDDGPHRITSVNGDPIGLVVYGWDSFVSYGYPGGTNVDLINID